MKVTSTEFIKSVFEYAQCPEKGLPEIAFLGRSNVGKSSLLNALLGVKGLARTSSSPGRTQSLNFFLINRKFYFVDLPGYGYARVPRDIRQEWGQMATDYLALRPNLVLSIQLVDSRHEPTSLDLQLNEWLRHHAKMRLVVATKADKLSQHELYKNLARIRQQMEQEAVIAFSAVKGRGRTEVWRAIDAQVEKLV